MNRVHTSSKLWDAAVSDEGRRLTLPYGHEILESLLEGSIHDKNKLNFNNLKVKVSLKKLLRTCSSQGVR